MKPTKNRVFCYGCYRPKMLFETQQKADNFIHYNTDAILEKKRKAPVRSYYCEICNGWHVTSNPSNDMGEEFDLRDHQLLNNIVTNKKSNEKYINPHITLPVQIEQIKKLITFGKFTEAEVQLNLCNIEINKYLKSHLRYNIDKFITWRGTLNKMSELIISAKDILSKPEDEQKTYATVCVKEQDEPTTGMIISNLIIIREVESLMNENESSLANGNINIIPTRIIRCKHMLRNLRGMGRKKVMAKYIMLFREQKQLMEMLQKKQSDIIKEKKQKQTLQTHQQNNKDVYKTTILSLIEKIEMIQKSFSDADYDSCETSLEIAYHMLDELHVNDDNTALIKCHLDKWSEQINNLNVVST